MRQTFLDRFWSKVDQSGDCWTWTGARNELGYGMLQLGPRGAGKVKAHRISYEIANGPVPAGLVLDHLCRNPSCVNPDHLEPVTQAENMRRGNVRPRLKANRAALTHCKNGHPFDEANTFVKMPQGHRKCRACARERWRRRAA